MPSSVPQEIPEKILRQECSNIETLPTKSNSTEEKHNESFESCATVDSGYVTQEIEKISDSKIGLSSNNEKSFERRQSSDSSSSSDIFNSEDSCDSEEDSSDDDSLFREDSVLKELRILFTEDEKSLIDEFYREMEDINVVENKDKQNALERIRDITNKYLAREIRINSYCNNAYCNNAYTVTDLILKKIVNIVHTTRPDNKLHYPVTKDELLNDNNAEIIISICSKLLLKGGRPQDDPLADEKSFLYENRELLSIGFAEDTELKCDEIMDAIESVAYESIVNKIELTKNNFAAEIDNCYFYIRYAQGTIVRVSTITNSQEIKDSELLDLRIGILQIGESVIRVESIGEKRNYTDVPKGSIKMSFTIKVEGRAEKISILLYPDKEDSNKVKVKLDQENQEKFNKLKDKSSLGKNCLLGGKNIVQAIQDQEFIRNHINEPDAPSTSMKGISISHIFDSLKNSFNQFGKYVLGG